MNKKINDMTNLEDDKVAYIEPGVYMTGCKDSVPNVIDIDKIIHDLLILWPIRDDQLQPLRWQRA